MKLLGLLALIFFSISTFAQVLDSTIRQIEIERNAKCSKVKVSQFGIHLGAPYGSTYYTVKYSCVSNEGIFKLKVRMRDSVVRKVIFKK